jgi:hypothetical protein
VPLLAGDVSWGVLGVDGLDVYRGGAEGTMADGKEVQAWLQQVRAADTARMW